MTRTGLLVAAATLLGFRLTPSMSGLTDIPGILVGHVTDLDAVTGCTAILCPAGAVAGCEVLGSATGTQELELLSPFHLTERVHGVCFAGGSAFGLEAVSGVRRFLEKQGIGYETRAARVPLVAGAILYDLALGRREVRPGREMGEQAASAANGDPVAEGAVGAGAGAAVGKLFGMARAMKSGIGSATVALTGEFSGILVAALAVVNAFGDVRDPESGRLLAGARTAPDSLDLAGTAASMLAGHTPGRIGENTTLALVATNAQLTKTQATQLARQSAAGMARAISPVWSTVDGDLIVALSAGALRAPVDALGVAGASALSQAIVRAVRFAPTLGGLPGLAR